jgi:hypothetical protein
VARAAVVLDALPNRFLLTERGKGEGDLRGGRRMARHWGIRIRRGDCYFGYWSWRPWRSLELESLEELGGIEDLGRAVETIEGALETTEDHC